MQFDPALAAQEALLEAANELGSEWRLAADLEDTFSLNAGEAAKLAYERLLALADRYPQAHCFQAFCIYITWQQAAEETIARHFRTGLALSERYLASAEGKRPEHLAQVAQLFTSFRIGLGLEEEDEIQVEFRRDTPKGGD